MTHKISISLPVSIYYFLVSYQEAYQLKTRSEVISNALLLLQQEELEKMYAEANNELKDDFDHAAGDGLS